MKNKTISVHKNPDGIIPYMGEFYQLETDTIVNKCLPGLGATTSEILADRDSIIVVPNTPVITGKCKAQKKDNLFGVMAKIMPDDIANYLYDTFAKGKHVKIMTTPESFWKVKQAFQEVGRSMYSCFLMWDECDKLTKDVDYREAITLPLDDFFQFPNKVMVSATPLHPSDPRFENFTWIQMVPEFDYRKDIHIIQTNNVLQCLKDMLSEGQDRPLFIFLNKTDMILALINKLGVQEESAVFCSEKSVDKLKAKGFECTYVDWNPEKAKKINFLTSRFFTAVDIILDEKPDVLIVTEPYLSDFTLMDPHTDVIQSIGRFRNGTNLIAHVVTVNEDFPIRTVEGINEYFNGAKMAYETVESLYNATTSEEARRALHDALEQLSFKGMITNGKPDHFKIDNYRDDALVKTAYHDMDLLIAAYESTGSFNLHIETPHLYAYGDYERLKLENASKSIKQKRKQIVEILDTLEIVDDTPLKDEYLEELRTVDRFIVDAYYKVGKKVIEASGYRVKPITEAMILKDYQTQANGIEMVKLLKNSFHIGQRYTLKFVKDELVRLYALLGITPPDHEKITAQTIRKFFKVKDCWMKNKKTGRSDRGFKIIESII